MSRHWKTAKNPHALVRDWTYYVEVCSFTFYFHSLEEVEEYLAYYQQKILGSSADGANREGYITRHHDGTRIWGIRSFVGDRWERHTRLDRLPLYLREESKRLKVIKALQRALKQWHAETDKT